ncbi:autophagy 8 [Neocallimastix lanati (nom. inval.)]|jgi:GABA(A) receptor-associated protein|nr:autophagy 8 [Neocallimastix sp. JGI-2020a]
MSFRDSHTFEERQKEAKRIREKYQDRIPCIVEKNKKSNIQDIDKKKFLVPSNLTAGQFMYVIRKRIKLQPDEALFVYIDGVNVPAANLMSTIYEEHKDEDGFLYMIYSGESTFGSL